jgi:hypothetical protein
MMHPYECVGRGVMLPGQLTCSVRPQVWNLAERQLVATLMGHLDRVQ